MAETLGSLIDKLSIKILREFHIKQSMKRKDKKFNQKKLKDMLKILKKQKKNLIEEIETFISQAAKTKRVFAEEKLKLYNEPRLTVKIDGLKNIGLCIDKLAKTNIELWNLEDEARRENVNNAYIGKIKKKINIANQKRNDLIDAIDRLVKKKITHNP